MSNRTARNAQRIHGLDPQFLVEKIFRERVYESVYWREQCFGLTAETLVDRAAALEYVGGVYANIQPTPFLCLLLKMLQIQPSKEIVLELLAAEEYKYMQILAAFYLRMVGKGVDIYGYLEQRLLDHRKIRAREKTGTYSLTHVDEIIDKLLNEDMVFGVALPRLTKRVVLEESGELEPRDSPLLAEIDAEPKDMIPEEHEPQRERSPSPSISPPREKRERWKPSRKTKIIAEPTVNTDRASLTIAETNALRIKLGLKPI